MNITKECAIYGCNSSSAQDNGIKLFHFPMKGTNEYEIWTVKLRESCNMAIPHNRLFICSLHFDPADIDEQQLRQNAIPLLKLPVDCFPFFDKVMREWVKRSQSYQHISRATLYEAAYEARLLLNIPRQIRNPPWVRNFRFQPILPDENGIIHMSRLKMKSHIRPASIISDLKNAERQAQDKQQQPLVDNELSNGFGDPIAIKTEAAVDDPQMSGSESSTQLATCCEIKIDNSEDTNDVQLNLCDKSDRGDTNELTIESYEDAIEYLKPLQSFVKERSEHFAAIGLLTQLCTIFKNPDEQ